MVTEGTLFITSEAVPPFEVIFLSTLNTFRSMLISEADFSAVTLTLLSMVPSASILILPRSCSKFCWVITIGRKRALYPKAAIFTENLPNGSFSILNSPFEPLNPPPTTLSFFNTTTGVNGKVSLVDASKSLP